MELGLSMIGRGLGPDDLRQLGTRAEAAGYSSLWTAEAWGADAFTPLAFLAATTSTIKLGTAIAQIWARTPGATAMTALTLQQLSGGRLQLGLGVSGPQVVEGWHGVAFQRPLAATRDYIAILRSALAADAKVIHEGEVYSVPYAGPGASGLGRPLRSTQPGAPDTPILVAAMGPRNTALAVEIADGMLPYLWSPVHWREAWGDTLAQAPDGFQVSPTVVAALGDDLAACRNQVRPRIAMHVGGMGSRDQNFYKALVERYGYEEEAAIIQDLFLSGDRGGAVAAVSDQLVDELALVGPAAHVADQLAAWREGPLATLIVEPTTGGAIEQIAEIWSTL
ncbi:LLM class F420-dependent oxidoreductase [Aquihabitans sp. McL0605]|uniref:LLM class F420-dependent oxidoreductase n=1 Tax=Aquihabitans sp. McL0605 TaxID=3415671 RepID=UPI003CF59DD0